MFKEQFHNLPAGSEKITRDLIEDSLSPGRNFNPVSPKYEALEITTQPQPLVDYLLWLKISLFFVYLTNVSEPSYIMNIVI
jgi:hypothetical protein